MLYMQMIVMLMVVATVYTACYFPINIVWVRHKSYEALLCNENLHLYFHNTYNMNYT